MSPFRCQENTASDKPGQPKEDHVLTPLEGDTLPVHPAGTGAEVTFMGVERLWVWKGVVRGWEYKGVGHTRSTACLGARQRI